MARTIGIPNMSNKNKLLLLKIMKDIVPTDNADWNRVALEYNKQHKEEAEKEGTPITERSSRTLKNHYEKKLATLKKPASPTADDENARLYKKVKEVETLIKRKTGTVDLTAQEIEAARESEAAQESQEAVSHSENEVNFEDESSSDMRLESDNERDLTDDETRSRESSPPPSSLCKRSRPFSPRPSNLCKRSKPFSPPPSNLCRRSRPFSPPSIQQYMAPAYSQPSNLDKKSTPSYKENSRSPPPSVAQSICRMADAMANKLENEARQDRERRELTLEMFQDEFVHTTREIANEIIEMKTMLRLILEKLDNQEPLNKRQRSE